MLPGLFYYYGGWDDKDNIVGHDFVSSQLWPRAFTRKDRSNHRAGRGNQIC